MGFLHCYTLARPLHHATRVSFPRGISRLPHHPMAVSFLHGIDTSAISPPRPSSDAHFGPGRHFTKTARKERGRDKRRVYQSAISFRNSLYKQPSRHQKSPQWTHYAESRRLTNATAYSFCSAQPKPPARRSILLCIVQPKPPARRSILLCSVHGTLLFNLRSFQAIAVVVVGWWW